MGYIIGPDLLDLLSLDDLENLRRSFEAAVGVPILLADAEGRPISRDIDIRRFCVAFLSDTPGTEANICLWCRRRTDRAGTVMAAMETARRTGRFAIDTCPGGFLDLAVPIHINGQVLGYGVFARCLDCPPNLEAYRAIAVQHGLDPDACVEAAAAATVLKREQIEAIASHLDTVVNFLVRVAADNYRTRREIEMAGEIQDSFIRKEHFIDGFQTGLSFRPCSPTGGDLMDAFRLGAGDAVFYAGDVSGHGVPAALIMSLLSGIVGATRHANVWPADMLGRLNAAFHEHFPSRMTFATMFYARYVASEQVLVYANAGHEPPLLVRHATGEIEELGAERSFPLGFFEDTEYSHGRVDLRIGDTIALYTDGFVDRKDLSGKWLEPRVLGELLKETRFRPVPEALSHIVAAVNERVATTRHEPCGHHGVSPDDDQGLLIIRREAVSEVEVPGNIDQVSAACLHICEQLEKRDVPADAIAAVRLALDEAITNAIRHGHKEDARKCVRVRYSVGGNHVKIIVCDEGSGIWSSGSKPISSPCLAGSGYGLALLKSIMDHIEWIPGGNEIFMVKKFGNAP